MKKSVKIISVFMVFVLMVTMLAACSKPVEVKTLAEILETNEEAAAAIQQLGESNGMEVEVVDNTVNYSIKLDSEIRKYQRKTYKKSFKNAFDSNADTFIEQIKEIEKETGIDGVVFHVTVLDAADNVILDQNYDKNGAVE